jgi:hypothetical protein
MMWLCPNTCRGCRVGPCPPCDGFMSAKHCFSQPTIVTLMSDLADFLLWAHRRPDLQKNHRRPTKLCLLLPTLPRIVPEPPPCLHRSRSITMWVRSAQQPHSTNTWSNSRPATGSLILSSIKALHFVTVWMEKILVVAAEQLQSECCWPLHTPQWQRSYI